MHRMVRGSVALLLGVSVLAAGPGALAQETTTTTTAPPPGHAITVTPATVDEPKEKITLSGPGFPDAFGCKFGSIIASGAALPEPKVLLKGDFDVAWSTQVDRWEDRTYFTEGVFDLTMSCTDESGIQNSYRTGSTLIVTASGVPAPDPVVTEPTSSTTTATQSSTQGTVEPSTAKAGETTVTIRGTGFKPSTKLDITLNTTPVTSLGTVNAFADGTYAATILIPATAPGGQHKLVVTGLGPDDVVRSTSADLRVIAANSTVGRTGSAAATGSGGAAATLPATGPSESTPYFVIAGLTAMTLGAFLVGMSHPAVPARGRHRRRRPRQLR